MYIYVSAHSGDYTHTLNHKQYQFDRFEIIFSLLFAFCFFFFSFFFLLSLTLFLFLSHSTTDVSCFDLAFWLFTSPIVNAIARSSIVLAQCSPISFSVLSAFVSSYRFEM